jgi:hypothetical protein
MIIKKFNFIQLSLMQLKLLKHCLLQVLRVLKSQGIIFLFRFAFLIHVQPRASLLFHFRLHRFQVASQHEKNHLGFNLLEQLQNCFQVLDQILSLLKI